MCMPLPEDREYSIVGSLRAALSVASTRTEVMAIILDQLFYFLKPDGALIALQDPESHEIVIELERGAWKDGTGIHLPPGVGISGYVILTGKPYLNNDARSDPRFLRPQIAGYLRAVSCVPLMAGGKAFGALWMGRRSDITEEDVAFITLMRHVAAPAIHRIIQQESEDKG